MAKRLFNRGFVVPKKGNKYKNEKVEFDGYKFDSKRECDRYIVLKDAERRGVISELVCQPKFELVPAVYRDEIKHLKTKDKIVKRCVQLAITYRGDFQYKKDGELVVEDVKISKFLVPEVFKIKEKLMLAVHGIKIKRVYKSTDEI